MMEKRRNNKATLIIASIIVVSGAAIALNLIPAFPIIGGTGFITLGALAGSIIGIYLGLRLGITAVIITLIVAVQYNSSLITLFGPFFFMPLVISYFVAATYYSRKPHYSLGTLAILYAIFIVIQYPYIIHYLSVLIYDVAVTIGLAIVTPYIIGKNILRGIGSIIAGIIADHMAGNLAWVLNYLYLQGNIAQLVSDPKFQENWYKIWNMSAYIYPIERTILIIIGAIIILSTLKPWEILVRRRISGASNHQAQ
ncbi:MAG: hypothetical protein GXO43_07095 [Crenarchaeota archaeon]|nr:hypothetical protein [Thermoproteota archaeon]